MSHRSHTLTEVYSSELFYGVLYNCCGDHEGFAGEEQVFSNEMVFPLEGVFVRRNSFGADLADKTKALFFKKGESYQISHPEAGPDVSFILMPRQQFLGTLLEGDGTAFPSGAHNLGPDVWVSVIKILWQLKAGGEPDLLAFDEAFANVAGNLLEKESEAPVKASSSDRKIDKQHTRTINRAKLFMNRHYRERISIREIAGAAYASPYHLCRLFRVKTGLSLHEYVTRLRLRESLDDLCSRDVSVTEIALKVGFNSHSHFGQAFQKTFGTTPSAFRQGFSSPVMVFSV